MTPLAELAQHVADSVLDTNTVLALWMFRDPRLTRLGAAVEAGRLRLVSREDAIEELRRVLAYPQFGLAPATRSALLAEYRARCRLLPPATGAQTGLPQCRDPDDQKFLDIALAGGARLLVSRDKALLRLARHARVRENFYILTPERLDAMFV